jgi:hypothetical protein
MLFSMIAALSLLSAAEGLKRSQPNLQARSNYSPKHARQLPANATGVQTLTTPQNITIRYKEPGKEGVCETTPGVKSYSGYIDLDVCALFFFEMSTKADSILGKCSHIFLVFRSKEQSKRSTNNPMVEWWAWFGLLDRTISRLVKRPHCSL